MRTPWEPPAQQYTLSFVTRRDESRNGWITSHSKTRAPYAPNCTLHAQQRCESPSRANAVKTRAGRALQRCTPEMAEALQLPLLTPVCERAQHRIGATQTLLSVACCLKRRCVMEQLKNGMRMRGYTTDLCVGVGTVLCFAVPLSFHVHRCWRHGHVTNSPAALCTSPRAHYGSIHSSRKACMLSCIEPLQLQHDHRFA